MRRKEGIHEGFKVGSPPLRQCIANLPLIVDAFAGELAAYRGQSFVKTEFEAFDFVIVGLEIVAWS